MFFILNRGLCSESHSVKENYSDNLGQDIQNVLTIWSVLVQV